MSSSTEGRVRVGIDLRLVGYRRGGIARYGVELLAALKDNPGLSLLALRAHSDDALGPRDLCLRTPPHHRLEQLSIPIELALRRARLDVYHVIDFIAPRMGRTPVIATVHDLAFRHWPNDLAPDALAYYRTIERSRRWTDGWIVPSEWTAGDLADVYGVAREAIHVIPHGDSLGLGEQPPLPREDRGDFILAVGTIEPRKRYDLLLDAVTELHPLVSLIVAGAPGWNTADTQRRLRSTEGVSWLESADDVRLRALYREALAVVVPSRAEGFGLSALEGMAAGTPVISSGGGALAEVTGAASLCVIENDPEAWAEAIRRVVTDAGLWNRMSADGRSRAREYSWRTAADATAAVYIAHAGN